jgi:transketolase
MNSMSELDRLAVNTIRMLAVDAVQKADSGHPGMPMGMADCAYVLWTRFLRYNPSDPDWLDRDRFVLSAGHGSMLLYSMLFLAGYGLTVEDLKRFRQMSSCTPGHPEHGCTAGVETTTGPLGQGFANGVGMALAAKMTAARFNTPDFQTISHRIFAIVSDGDLMEGVSSEAASIAGHLQLGNLVYLYDNNGITIEGKTNLAFSENVAGRFQAYGWQTIAVDGHDHEAVAQAIQSGIDETQKPTLILARTHIGFGSPNKQDSAGVHGAPLGADEVKKTKEHLGWPLEPTFFVPDEVKVLFKKRVEALLSEYQQWQNGFDFWRNAHADLATTWDVMRGKTIPDDLETSLISVLTDKPNATRNIGGQVLNKAAQLVPSIVGGSADLSPSTKTMLDKTPDVTPGDFAGRNLHFGIREHAMGSIMNGLALYGGFIPYGSTFLVFADYMRPPIRLASIMKLQSVFVFTHDSIFVGEDGPTHQPVEQIATLRAIPGLAVFRPADGLETALAWAFALRRKDGPTVLCLTRQNVPPLVRPAGFDNQLIQKGGYVLVKESGSKPECVLVATGSEVAMAVEAAKLLAASHPNLRVASMPSLDRFLGQPEKYRESVIPADTPVVVIEAGISQGWHAITRSKMLFITMDRFGESAPAEELAEKFGFTGKAVAERVGAWLK